MRILLRQRRLFRNLNAQERENLGLVAIALFFLLYLAWLLATLGLFAGVGCDYLGFWSAGVVANRYGYAQVYNLEVMRSVGATVVPMPHDRSLAFVAMPVLFLPVFLLPFQLLALLDARVGFGIWTIGNIVLLAWYLLFFTRKAGHSSGKRLVLVAMLSFPVFATLFEGQVNVFLTICIGEFLRAMLENRPVRAGLWLGGFLLKPQSLILILVAALIHRSWKALFGFLMSACLLLGISLWLGGKESLAGMMKLWIAYLGDIGPNSPENMMNWRMVTVRLSSFTAPWIGWSIGIGGMALSLIAVGLLWRASLSPTSPHYSTVLLGTLAGTGAITWHAHVHMLILLLPPLLLLNHQPWCKRIWNLFLFSLPLAAFSGLILGLLVDLKVLPSFERPEGLPLALTALALNLYILLLALQVLERWWREGTTTHP